MMVSCPRCKRLTSDESFHFCFSSIQDRILKELTNSCVVCGIVSDVQYIHNVFNYCDEHYVDLKNRITENERYFMLEDLRNI